MKKYTWVAIIILCGFLVRSSNTPTPEKYLYTAVGTSFKVAGFAGDALSLELEHPPVRKKKGRLVTITRKELIEEKIRFSRQLLDELGSLKNTPDANNILTGSIDLHQFVIKVYETDYTALAELYDRGAPKAQIAAFDAAIKNKHASMFELHYENLLRGGRLYAARHQLTIKRAG